MTGSRTPTSAPSRATSPECGYAGRCTGDPIAGSPWCERHTQVERWATVCEQREAQTWTAADHAEDRSIILGVARAWDDVVSAFMDNGLSVRQVERALYNAVAPCCHPASRPLVSMLMPALLDAVERREGFRSGSVSLDEVLGGVYVWRDSYEVAAELLDDDVEDALRPLLDGVA